MESPSQDNVTDVLIWVRTDDEDPEEFVYRGMAPDLESLVCYGNPLRDARDNWVILSTSPLALKPCDDKNAPTDNGTLYSLRRAP
jgi:hypothetical protein